MSKDSGRMRETPEVTQALRPFRRELWTALAEAQEEAARTATDPKLRENYERSAKDSREAAHDWD
jgi:collagenase-like PrtC family protease